MGEAREAKKRKGASSRKRERGGRELEKERGKVSGRRSPRREFERPQITERWCGALEVGFVGRWKRAGEVGGSDNRGVDGWTGGRVDGWTGERVDGWSGDGARWRNRVGNGGEVRGGGRGIGPETLVIRKDNNSFVHDDTSGGQGGLCIDAVRILAENAGPEIPCRKGGIGYGCSSSSSRASAVRGRRRGAEERRGDDVVRQNDQGWFGEHVSIRSSGNVGTYRTSKFRSNRDGGWWSELEKVLHTVERRAPVVVDFDGLDSWTGGVWRKSTDARASGKRASGGIAIGGQWLENGISFVARTEAILSMRAAWQAPTRVEGWRRCV
ncbi:hypothetical protein WN55_01924 [Dufourea novaeangliae]|uniref:Uncharacterized protein n=1 Tax=Dufourea novaeangliae TaxID=178035 RepID=A0A154PF76_DUFNO|nr:hypothetical protein WN55_01924 [Dufourea novaeangliae]